MSGDSRGWRIALVPDALVNSAQRTPPDVMRLLEAAGYGVLQLPASADHGLLLAVIADQVAEYSHHGYAVLAIGLGGTRGNGLHWRRLAPLLRNRGVALPLRHIVRQDVDAALEEQRLAAVLASHDLPVEEQKRWRV